MCEKLVAVRIESQFESTQTVDVGKMYVRRAYALGQLWPKFSQSGADGVQQDHQGRETLLTIHYVEDLVP